MRLSDVPPELPAVGLTADRWEVLVLVCAVVLFTCGVMIARNL